MISRVICTDKLHSSYGLIKFSLSWKKLLVFTNTELHLKSRGYYLY